MTNQSGIVRRPDFAGGGITEEERERIVAHLALWIQRPFRTEPADPRLIEEAIKGLYRAANFAEPRVIVVPSPAVMKIAGGIALTWWYLFENQLFGAKPDLENQLFGANEEPGMATTWHHFASTSWTAFQTHSAAVDATKAATSAAIDDVTSAAIGDVHWRATRDTTGFAAEPAIDELTEAEIDDTICLAAYDAIRDATYGAIGAEELTGFDPAVQFAEFVSLPLRDEVEVWTWFDLAVRFVGRDNEQFKFIRARTPG
jgi:hypothetical protein